jgi:hypothetical protein
MNDVPTPKSHLSGQSTSACVHSFSAAEEQALEAFGHWLDAELDKLVAQWVHLAAPSASRAQRTTRR